jgi:hypothetical protein
VACWLATAGNASCIQELITPTNQSGVLRVSHTKQSLLADDNKWSMTKLTPERLVIGVPSQTARLGEPLEIPLHVALDGLIDIAVGDKNNSPGSGTTKITRRNASTSYVQIIPMHLGHVEYGIAAKYKDGAAAIQWLTLGVKPPLRPPESFTVNGGVQEMRLSLNTPDEANNPIGILRPEATYGGIDGKVDLDPSPGYNFVSYTVLPGNPDPGITVQPNGFIRAVRPGEATIEAHFGTALDQLHVIVQETMRR